MEERFERYHPDMEAMHRSFRTEPCFVCRMVDGDDELPRYISYEDERAVDFLDGYPRAYGYTLVAPKEHREQVTADFTMEEYIGLQRLVYQVAEAVRKEVGAERMYIFTFGSNEGNSHVHWHVVPLPAGVPYEDQQGELEQGRARYSQREDGVPGCAHREKGRGKNVTDHHPHHVVAVTGIVTDGGDRVLLVKGDRRGWEPPGGQVELGEDLFTALKREVREEAGVEVGVPLKLIASGWHRLVVVAPDRVFVFPRHQGEVPMLEREADVLSSLEVDFAPRLLGLHRDDEGSLTRRPSRAPAAPTPVGARRSPTFPRPQATSCSC